MIPYSISSPTNEDIFEELCLALLKQHWVKPRLERFGRRGERQNGVEQVYSRNKSGYYPDTGPFDRERRIQQCARGFRR
jgi:hypothetical protein